LFVKSQDGFRHGRPLSARLGLAEFSLFPLIFRFLFDFFLSPNQNGLPIIFPRPTIKMIDIEVFDVVVFRSLKGINVVLGTLTRLPSPFF